MNSIFATNAPKYWGHNLSVIPLYPKDKRPIIDGWQFFADRMPTQSEQDMWLTAYPGSNLGLVMGPSSGVVALDIDTDDDGVQKALDGIFPMSPWVRIGARGAVMLYRYGGERTFNIKNKDGMLLQCLSKGAQIALPPSIHPDTQRPYISNVELTEVIATLPALPSDLEKKIREALNSAGYDVGQSGSTKVSVFIPAGSRDNSMVAHAGILSRGVCRGERTLLEALAEIKHWVENFVEEVAGDALSVDKAQQKVIEFLIRDHTGEKKTPLPVGWDEGLTLEMKDQMGLGFTIDTEQWDADRIKTFLLEEFGKHPEVGSSGWISAVEIALNKIVHGNLGLQEDTMVRFIAEQSGSKIGVVAIRKRLAALKKGEREGLDHSELARWVLADLNEFGEIRFHANQFWQWKGANWERMDETIFQKHIAEEYGAFPAARKQGDHKGIMRVIANLITKPLETVKVKGMNFANGYLNDNLELLPHNSDFGCTYVLPYRYLAERQGHCPMFMQVLHDCWGQDPDFQDKMDALQEAMAATMFGVAPNYQRAILLYGAAQTGKSQVLSIMQGLLPPGTISAVPPHDWDDRFLPSQMHNKLMNICGELSESRLLPGEIFKTVVEGGTISGQQKNRPIFEFNPFCAQWYCSNHAPKSRDHSEGFIRRWLFLTFSHPIPREKIIIDLHKIILAAEREEIAAWAAAGITRLKKNNGYTLPTSHMVMTEQVANNINSVRYFLSSSSKIKMDPLGQVSGDTLFRAYYSFCLAEQAAKGVLARTFHTMMRDLQHTMPFQQRNGPKNSLEYHGIMIVNE